MTNNWRVVQCLKLAYIFQKPEKLKTIRLSCSEGKRQSIHQYVSVNTVTFFKNRHPTEKRTPAFPYVEKRAEKLRASYAENTRSLGKKKHYSCQPKNLQKKSKN